MRLFTEFLRTSGDTTHCAEQGPDLLTVIRLSDFEIMQAKQNLRFVKVETDPNLNEGDPNGVRIRDVQILQNSSATQARNKFPWGKVGVRRSTIAPGPLSS